MQAETHTERQTDRETDKVYKKEEETLRNEQINKDLKGRKLFYFLKQQKKARKKEEKKAS